MKNKPCSEKGRTDMKITQDRINISTFPYWHFSLEYTLNSIAASGLKNIEFWAASPQYCYADYVGPEREARKQEIIAMLRKFDLKMPVFYPEQCDMYPLNIASPVSYIRDHSIQYLKEYIDDARDFGAGIMIVGPGHQVFDNKDSANYSLAVDALRQLCEYAAQYDIDLAVEEWPAFMCTFASNAVEIQKLLADVGAENLKVCLNTLAARDNGCSVADYLRMFGDKLVHVHFADDGSGALGTGTAALEDLRILEASDYSGAFSLTLQFDGVYLDPDKPVKHSAAWLRRVGFC